MSTTPRRGRAMPTDGPTAKFLYTIIKQLDLKSVSEFRPALSLGQLVTGHFLIDRLEPRCLPTRNLQRPCGTNALFPLQTTDGGHRIHHPSVACQETPEQVQGRLEQGRYSGGGGKGGGERRAAKGGGEARAWPDALPAVEPVHQGRPIRTANLLPRRRTPGYAPNAVRPIPADVLHSVFAGDHSHV